MHHARLFLASRVYAHVCIGVLSCVCACGARAMLTFSIVCYSPPNFLRQDFSLNVELFGYWGVGQHLVPTCLHPSSAVVVDAHLHAWLIGRHWGSKPRSSCFCSSWSTEPILRSVFLTFSKTSLSMRLHSCSVSCFIYTVSPQLSGQEALLRCKSYDQHRPSFAYSGMC